MLDTRYPDADDSPGLLLWRVGNAWQAAQRAALTPFGLTHVQFVLLASLTWLEGDALVSQSDVAEQAGTDPAMTSQVLRVLESKGLIERRPHPADTRAKALKTTPAGRELANTATAAVEAIDQAFFAPLARDAQSFTSALQVLDRVHRRHARHEA